MTHAHLDHVGGVAALKKLKPAARIMIHQADEFIYDALPEQPAWIGIPRKQWAALGFDFEPPPKVDGYWEDGQVLRSANSNFRSCIVPATHPGHVVLFAANGTQGLCRRCAICGFSWTNGFARWFD